MIVRTTVKSIQDIMRQDVGFPQDHRRSGSGTRNHPKGLPLTAPRKLVPRCLAWAKPGV